MNEKETLDTEESIALKEVDDQDQDIRDHEYQDEYQRGE